MEPCGDFRQARGCSACRKRGCSGRLVIHETLLWTPELEKALARDGAESSLAQIANAQDFKSMVHDGVAKAAAGLTTLEEVLAAVRV